MCLACRGESTHESKTDDHLHRSNYAQRRCRMQVAQMSCAVGGLGYGRRMAKRGIFSDLLMPLPKLLLREKLLRRRADARGAACADKAPTKPRGTSGR
jgi:hypothetical protein